MRTLLCALALPLLATVSFAWSQGRVHVVDAAGRPGSTFTDLSQAATAAADGDVLLVRSGDYADDLLLDHKGLTVVAEAGSAVDIDRVEIQNLPAGRFALLQGLASLANVASLELDQDQGPIWLEGCTFEGFFSPAVTLGSRVNLCETVVLSRGLVRGPPDPLFLGAADTLQVLGSRLFVHDSQIEALAPGSALALSGSFLELTGSSVSGGDGANGTAFSCNGKNGGIGLLVVNSSRVSILDSVLEGGTGGLPFGSCNPGIDGDDLVSSAGSATFVNAEARSLELVSPVREDELFRATFSGRPGDRVWILYSALPGAGIASRSWDGELLLATPRSRFIGTIPASGSLAFQMGAPDLATGAESAIFFSQAFFRDAVTGRFVLSSPSAVVVLDDSF